MDKFEEWAKEFEEHTKLVESVRTMPNIMRFCAEKMEEERAKETCETCIDSGDCEMEMASYIPRYEGLPVFGCRWWGRRIVEPQSVLAPTSAGGTVKSPAVTPDEGVAK